MRGIGWTAAALAALSVSGSVSAAGGSVQDQAVILTYGATHWSAAPDAQLTGADATGSQVRQAGWWYRAGSDTREFPLPVPDVESYVAGRILAGWTDVDGKGFRLRELTWVFDSEGPSGGFVTQMTVENLGTATSEFVLFHYLDVDMAASAGGDSGTRVNPRFLKFSDGASTASYKATGALHHQVAEPGELLGLLNDAAPTDLDDAVTTLKAGDRSAAYEFGPFKLDPGEVRVFWLSLAVNPASDHVKGDFLGALIQPPLYGQAADLSRRQFPVMRRTTQFPVLVDVAAPAATAGFVGIDDFDGDYKDEGVFRDTLNGTTYVGADPIVGAPTFPLNWKVSATGDFDHDGKADILWRNANNQQLVIWAMNGNARLRNIVPNPDQAASANWDVAAAADFNGDGNRDLLWYNQTTGKLVLWHMDGSVVRSAGLFTTPSGVGNNNWRVVAVGDYGKGPGGVYNTQDIVWQNDASHKLVVWHMDQSATRTSGVFTAPDTLADGLAVVGPR